MAFKRYRDPKEALGLKLETILLDAYFKIKNSKIDNAFKEGKEILNFMNEKEIMYEVIHEDLKFYIKYYGTKEHIEELLEHFKVPCWILCFDKQKYFDD